jgi:DNA polymerase III subunit gamma/tau
MAYEPLHHKYRPQTFGDLVGQETIALTLSNALEQAKIAPAYLFTGPRGTGKTSSARILAKSLNCLNSDRPTPHPCGKCEVCLAIARGSALDVMEIDAASNTGVDNIREIIERSRFAPVQCRYKIYVIDECLTGDSLIQTREGLMQIDNPDLEGKQALSYNEKTKTWEYKEVLRWLERGTKETLTIKTGSSQISCTANHLIRTETGWIEARNVKEGMKIFSPASADAERTSTNTERMDEYVDSLEDISSKETNTEQNPIISTKFKYKQKLYSLCANADVKKNLMFQAFYKKKAEESKAFNPTGTDIRIKKVMDSGINLVHKVVPLSRENTSTSNWEQNPVENGYQIYNNIPFPQWTTNLETVESVSHAGHEQVYDLEVEDNHNFVANDLLVHNCHMLSTAAFNALLKTLEEPPPQVVFVLATTDPQRVLSTIISRCQRFDYRRIPLTEMTSHLRYIADAENIAIADDALTLVAQIANGGLRDAESLLDQLSLLPETITVEKVWDLVGAVPEQDLLKLLQAINANDSLAVLQQCRNLLDRGREPLVVLQNLAGFYLNLLIAKTAPNHAELTAVTETCWQQLCTEATNWQTTLILRGQQHLQDAETQLKRTTQPRLWLEVTLLGLLPEAQAAVVQGTAIAIPAPNPVVTPIPTVAPREIAPTPAIAIENQEHHVERNHRDDAAKPISSPQPNSVPLTHNTIPAAVQATQHLDPNQSTAEVNTTPKVEPPPVAPRNDQDPVANQEIWSKVVSCLQPPTTQALLKQQCHLVNFDGISAIVGVSSANLQKMTQQKIPNIEAAFAQACQRKVRVQLEVVSSQGKTAPNSTAGINPRSSSTPEQPPDPPPPARVQTVPSIENVSMKPQSLPSQQNQATAPLVTPTTTSDHHQLEKSDRSNGRASASPTLTYPPPASVNNYHAVTNPLPVTVNVPLENLENLENNVSLAEDYGDSDLQQAIASLTQSFEGELVQLDNLNGLDRGNSIDDLNLDNTLDESFAESESETEILTPPEIPNHLDRPDLEEYNDEW